MYNTYRRCLEAFPSHISSTVNGHIAAEAVRAVSAMCRAGLEVPRGVRQWSYKLALRIPVLLINLPRRIDRYLACCFYTYCALCWIMMYYGM